MTLQAVFFTVADGEKLSTTATQLDKPRMADRQVRRMVGMANLFMVILVV